jgi:predicted transposase YbfD/YdcC
LNVSIACPVCLHLTKPPFFIGFSAQFQHQFTAFDEDPGKIESERYIKSIGETENEICLYISSLQADAGLISRSLRARWGVENSLHWVPDVGFNEDNIRKRTGFAVQNCSLLNRITLRLLKNEKTTEVGVRGKRLKAG